MKSKNMGSKENVQWGIIVQQNNVDSGKVLEERSLKLKKNAKQFINILTGTNINKFMKTKPTVRLFHKT